MSAAALERDPFPDPAVGTPLGKAARLERLPRDRRAGLVCTAAHDDGPPYLTFHAQGAPRDALLAACARIDAMGDGWHIRSLSTPSSVYRDLQGTRRVHRSAPRVSANNHEEHPFSDDPRTSEIQMLSGVGRLDLLRPLPFTIAVSA